MHSRTLPRPGQWTQQYWINFQQIHYTKGGNVKLMVNKKTQQQWWEEKWKEREDILRSVFGETYPPGMVTSFFWDDFDSMVPGGCALVFPPRTPFRENWLVITHGLTQPLSAKEVAGVDMPSGYGYEFGFLANDNPAWAPEALQQLLTYVMQSGTPIERGHRVPMGFFPHASNIITPELGKIPEEANHHPLGEMRAVLFWPYMSYPRGFSSSTGYFSILLGTTITQTEWNMAKATSSAHLLLLLFKAGIGQISDLLRPTVTNKKRWASEWQSIRCLPEEEVEQLLLEYATLD